MTRTPVTSSQGSWLLRFPRPDAPRRLFCFAYAGGHGGVFASWRERLGTDVEVIGMQLPGHGARLAEAPRTELLDVAAEAARVIAAEDDPRPYALFGHSLGAVLAFETARRLAGLRSTRPSHLFVSACEGPRGLGYTDKSLHLLPDDALVQRLREFNGTPPEVLGHQALMRLMLPILRADFAMLGSYRYREAGPLDVPMTIFGGRHDHTTPADVLESWVDETTRRARTVWIDGDHFFINSHRDALLGEIRRDLTHDVGSSLSPSLP